MKVDQTFNNQSVASPVGGTVELSLAENPTTGFRWTMVSNGAPICELRADDFIPAGPNPGAGGTRSFKFLLRQAGEATIALRNRRKWGGADGADFTLNVRATVSA